jgi:glycosyltransferase involved in cell wall biosynthesis
VISVVIPTLNEARGLESLLPRLAREEESTQIIVVDGGSADESTEIASRLGAQVLSAPRGWFGLRGVEKRCLIVARGWRSRRAARWGEAGWIDWLTDRFEAARDRGGLDHKRDDAQLGATLGAKQGKDFVDPCQEQGPEVGARPVV